MNEPGIERALRLYRLALPRTARVGRAGGIAGQRAGGSLELHDFRDYQPGDDPRQLDWNAVARTGQLIVRIRREEVSPRVEVVLDASRSMAITGEKATRALELASFLTRLAQLEGLNPVLVVARRDAQAVPRDGAERLHPGDFDGDRPLDQALRPGLLRACGVRIVISDFLFEAPLDALCARVAQGAALAGLIQVVDREDVDPGTGIGATLIDSETHEQLPRVVGDQVLSTYRRRWAAHQAQLLQAARRAQAAWCQCVAQEPLEESLGKRLAGTVLEVRA